MRAGFWEMGFAGTAWRMAYGGKEAGCTTMFLRFGSWERGKINEYYEGQ